MHQIALLLILGLGFQEKPVDEEFDEIVASMRLGLEERAAGYKKLLELRHSKPGITRLIADRIAKETDPRIRMRLTVVLGAYMADLNWVSKLDSENLGNSIVVADRFYFQKKDGTSVGLSMRTGESEWTGPKMNPWVEKPVVTKDHIWIQHTAGKKTATLAQLTLTDGKLVTTTTIDQGKFRAEGETILFRQNGQLRSQAISATRKGWNMRTTDRTLADIAGNVVAVWDGEGVILGIDAKTAKATWNAFFDWSMNFFEGHGDILIVRSWRPRLRAIEAATGKVLWSLDFLKTDPEGTAGLVVTDKFILTLGSVTVCRELKTGVKLWTAQVAPLKETTMPYAILDTHIVWAEGAVLHGYNLQTGQGMAKQETHFGPIQWIIPAEDGNFLAVHKDATVASWRFAGTVIQPAPKPVEKPAEKPPEKPAEKPPGKPEEKSDD